MTTGQDESASMGWRLIRVPRNRRETPLPHTHPEEEQARDGLVSLLNDEAATRADRPPTRSMFGKAATAAQAREPFTLPGGVTYTTRQEGS